MKLQGTSLAVASLSFFLTASLAQTTTAPAAATTSGISELESLAGVGLSFIRSVLSTSASSTSSSSSSSSTTTSSTSSSLTSSSTTSSSSTSTSKTNSSTGSSSSASSTATVAAANNKGTSNSGTGHNNLAIILGVVLGTIVVLLLSLLCFLCSRRRRRKRERNERPDTPLSDVGYGRTEKRLSSQRSISQRSLSQHRNGDYANIPPVPPPHRLSGAHYESLPYGPASAGTQRGDPFLDGAYGYNNYGDQSNYAGRHRSMENVPIAPAPYAHGERSARRSLPDFQQQSSQEYFPYQPPQHNLGQEPSPTHSFGSAQTLGGNSQVPVPARNPQRPRSLPRSSLANEFDFGFDGRGGRNELPREFRRKQIASHPY